MATIREYLKNRQKEKQEEYQQKISAHKRKVRLIVITVVVAAATVVIGFLIYWNNRSFSEYTVLSSRAMDGTTNSKYYKFGEGILVYTDDGMSYIEDNDIIWNQAFEMKNPIVDICNETVAICDKKNTTVYIYDLKGEIGKIDTVYPILDLNVSEQGVVAAITRDSETDRIEVLDKEGNAIATGQTYITGDGCPIDIDISNDGTKLIASYIYIEGNTAKSKVVFYNYSEVGKNEIGRIVGGFNHYGSTIVSRVEFLDNDTSVVFGEDIFTIYEIKQKPEKKAEVSIDKNIKSIFYDKEYIGMVLDSEDYEEPYIVKLYDTNGEECMSYTTDFAYTGISSGEKWFILYSETECLLMTTSGKERFKGNISEGIHAMICTEKSEIYYVINEEYDILNIKMK